MKPSDMKSQSAWIRNEFRVKRPGEHGIALISVILLILVLSFVSAATIVMSTTELKIGANFKTSIQSFYNAEAGVQYALGKIRNKYAAGTLNLTGSTVMVNYSSPNISVYPLLSNGNIPFSNWATTSLYLKNGTTTDYMYNATGYYANSNTSLQVLLRIPSFYLVKGMFANTSVDIKNGLNCVGTPEFGSNGNVDSKMSVLPKVVLGGSATDTSGSPSVTTVPIIPNDPAPGVASKVFFNNYSSLNNNLTPPTSIASHVISSPPQLVLRPGNYYLKSLTNGDILIDNTPLFNGSKAVNIYVRETLSLKNITIPANYGPLTIYYHGPGTVGLGSATLNSGGAAGNLSIVSDTASIFDFESGGGGTYSGLFFAPYADFNFKNNDNVKGLLWGNNITIKNNINFQYDDSAASFLRNMSKPLIVNWKQL